MSVPNYSLPLPMYQRMDDLAGAGAITVVLPYPDVKRGFHSSRVEEEK